VVLKLTDAPHRENQDLGRQALDVAAFAARYLTELKRRLTALDIQSAPELCGRRSTTVSGKRIVDYSVRASSLNADQSLVLQTNGLVTMSRMPLKATRLCRSVPPLIAAPMPSGVGH